MAIFIIKLFKAVQIKINNCQTISIHFLHTIVKIPPISQACQLIGLSLLQKLFPIGLLLSNILGYTNSTNKVSLIIKRCLVGQQLHHTAGTLYLLPITAGVTSQLYILLCLNADILAILIFLWCQIPNIIMLLTPNILLGLFHCITKGIIYAPMLTKATFEPNQVQAGIYNRLQLRVPQPGILFQLFIIHQTGKKQFCCSRHQLLRPNIVKLFQFLTA